MVALMEVEILSFRVTKQSNRKIALFFEMTDWNIQQENGFQKCASHSLQKIIFIATNLHLL